MRYVLGAALLWVAVAAFSATITAPFTLHSGTGTGAALRCIGATSGPACQYPTHDLCIKAGEARKLASSVCRAANAWTVDLPVGVVGLTVQGAPDLLLGGPGTTVVTVPFVSGTPIEVKLSRDGMTPFATWTPQTPGPFFALTPDGKALIGSWCITSECWGGVAGPHTLDVLATYADGRQAKAQVTLNVIAPVVTPPVVPPVVTPGPAVSVPTIVRSRVIASDGTTFRSDGLPDNGWGGNQPRVTSHADGSVRIGYLSRDGGGTMTWTLMRMAADGTVTREAGGATTGELAVLRDPITDGVHVVAWPGLVPHVYSSPSFAPVAIPVGSPFGNNPPNSAHNYCGAAIGPDGTLVLKVHNDLLIGTYTATTQAQYISGKRVGGAWQWSPKISKTIGERHAYDFLLPAGSEFVGVSLRDVEKSVAGLPNLSASYAWDGVRQYATGYASASTWRQFDLMPRRTAAGGASTAAWMAIQDAFADSRGRVFTLHRVSDPAGPSGMYLTVSDGSRVLYQGTVSLGGNPRFYEDSKARLWVLDFNDSNVRVHRLNADFTLGSATTLNLSPGYQGFGRIAAPRGGTVPGMTVAGAYPSGTQMVAYQIRLPD